ncbi:C40 family peptidase [Lactobacillus sp. LL6]|uniref:C40 family peptidase n=1 Tax=Lactobacillus sp. LL6 TaxID=2596827 RepID=UPI0011855E69|nr:C40 family peptidase [Lactobacillus sp. LL6]TSO25719.1 NlpC/P60 family protein [Lactobacillus sp. LL6]
MKFNNKFVKAAAAATLAVTGVTAVHEVSAQSGHVQAATMSVKINYVPGYGINIWDNFNHGHFTGVRAAHGTTYQVLDTQIDKKGRTWYSIGENQWILAKYTVNVNSVAAKNIKAKKVKKAKKVTPAVSQAPTATDKQETATQSTGDASAVVSLANEQVGKSYVWGGTTPKGFDCSGLAQYVYKKATGVDISRTTYSQVNQGKSVSLRNLKPGDLLFWGSTNSPYHVGIYVGNNQYIHAATPSQGVIKQTLSSYFYPSAARRVLN